jgi:hypothetical protein
MFYTQTYWFTFLCIFLNLSSLYLFTFVLKFSKCFFIIFFSARANLSRFLVDKAATRKQLAQVQGQLEKMERKNKEMLQWFLNVLFFYYVCAFFKHSKSR